MAATPPRCGASMRVFCAPSARLHCDGLLRVRARGVREPLVRGEHHRDDAARVRGALRLVLGPSVRTRTHAPPRCFGSPSSYSWSTPATGVQR